MSDEQANPYAPRPDGTPPPPAYGQQPPVPPLLPPPPPAYQPTMPPAPPAGSYGQQPPAGPPGFPPAAPTGYAPTYGQPAMGYGYGVQTPTNSGKAVAVLVLGIVGIVMTCMWGIGIIPAIVGLCLAPGAKREVRGSNGWKTGDGMIKAGVICAWIAVALSVIFLVAAVALIGFGQHATSATYSN